MRTMTAEQAERIMARTAEGVRKMRAEADVAEWQGDVKGAAVLRMIADSRERSVSKVREGARIGSL